MQKEKEAEKVREKGYAGIIDKTPLLLIVIIGLIVILLNQTIINILIPRLMLDFGITASTAQWLSTGFMLVTAILIPISAYLVQRFTYQQLFLASMAFFTVGSLVCGLAPNFSVMLAGRLLQAVGGGIIIPLAMNIMLAVFPLESRGSAMGFFGLGMIVAPALGPTVGGYIIDTLEWNIMFYAMAILGAIVFVAGFFNFKLKNERNDAKLDIVGTILSTIGFASLLFGISESGTKGWGNSVVLGFLIFGCVCLAVFVIHSLHKENPLLQMNVFKNRNFSYTLVLSCIIQMALFSGMMLLPIYLQSARGFSAFEVGILLLPGTLIAGFMGVITGRMYDRHGAKLLVIFGMGVLAVTMYLLSTLTETTAYATILIIYTVRSFAMAFVMMPVTTAALAEITPDLLPHANALMNTIRQVAAAVGVSAFIAIMTSGMQSYLADSGNNITQEASTLAIIHGVNLAFWIATLVCIAALILAFFLKKPKVLADPKALAELEALTELEALIEL